MFLVGCYSWFRPNALLQKADVLTAILQSSSVVFCDKAFGWNKQYFVTTNTKSHGTVPGAERGSLDNQPSQPFMCT